MSVHAVLRVQRNKFAFGRAAGQRRRAARSRVKYATYRNCRGKLKAGTP